MKFYIRNTRQTAYAGGWHDTRDEAVTAALKLAAMDGNIGTEIEVVQVVGFAISTPLPATWIELEMTELLIYAQHGLGLSAFALVLNRILIGAFFSISGFHKLFNDGRHDSLVSTLKQDGVPFLPLTQWLVPICEFSGGLMLVLNLLAPVAALVLITICTVAICVDGIKRVAQEKPIDAADRVDDYLYLPELLYVLGLVIVLFAGPGEWA